MSNDVVEFLGETGVVAELEGLDPMGLEAVGAPNAAHRRAADASLFGHGAAAPVSGIGRPLLGGFADHLLYFVRSEGRLTTRPRGIFLDAGDAGLDKAVPPARDQLAPDGHLCGDWFILPTVGGEQDNLGSQREANRDRPAAGLSLQLLALGFGQCHSWCCSHLFLLPDEDLANNL